MGEGDQQGDHHHPHVETGVSFGLGPKRGENARGPASRRDRSANPATEMTVERPGEHQDRKHDEVGPVGRQAPQPAEYRGSETRNQRGGSSSRAGRARKNGTDPAKLFLRIRIRHLRSPVQCSAGGNPPY